MWVCHTVPERAACATTSSAEIAHCLYKVKDSLEELAIGPAYIKMCPHDTGVLDRLHECPKLTTMTLTPQTLLGWQVCQTVTDSTLESSYLAILGRVSRLLPQNLVKIRVQAWTEGNILKWFIESIVGNSDLRLLDVIELESISDLKRIFAPDYAFGARYPLYPVSFQTYMRLYKQCQAAGLTLRNCKFDRQRRKVAEAGALESPHLWNDEKLQHRNPLLQAVLTGNIPWKR